MTEVIGKYFRLLCIIAFPAGVIYLTWTIIENLPRFNFYIFIVWIFLVCAIILEISFLRHIYKEKVEIKYEGWAAAFYFLVIGGLLYFLLNLISSYIGFNILGYVFNQN